MTSRRSKLLDDPCWVYVQQHEKETYVVGITYEEEFQQREISAGRPPLLWRKFNDTFSAAGYRIVLKKMTTAALQEVLKDYDINGEEYGKTEE